MSQGIILLADNDRDFLNQCAEPLLQEYHILQATNIEDVEQTLRTQRVHLLILEVRMTDPHNAEDISGLDFACREEYRHIPKIVLTANPSLNHVRTALAPGPHNIAPAVGFLDKHEEFHLLPQVIETTFEEHISINRDLYIHQFSDSEFFIESDADIASQQLDTQEELKELYGKLFPDYAQVTLGNTLLQVDNRAIGELWAYSHSGAEEYYVVSYGLHQDINSEHETYQRLAPKNGPSGVTQQSSDIASTQRFTASKYTFLGLTENSVEKFQKFYHTQTVPEIYSILEQLYKATLSLWHTRQNFKNFNIATATLYKQWLKIDDQQYAQLHQDTWQKEFLREVQRCSLDKIKAIGSAEDGYLSVTGLKNSFARIEKLLEQTASEPSLQTIGVTHGRVTIDTIMVDRNSQTWLIDFSQADHRPLECDYVSLEMSIRLHCLNNLDLAERSYLEEQLSARDFGELLPKSQDYSATDKAVATIQQIRNLAIELHHDHHLQTYELGLFYSAIAHLARYQEGIYHTVQEFLPIVHSYLLASTLAERLVEQAVPDDALSFEINMTTEQTWIDGEEITLTPQEWQILKCLYENRNTLQTHEEIYTYAFAEDLDLITDRDRYTTAMNRLLKKVDPDRRDSKLIFSHRGRGYRLQYGLDDIIE